MEGMELIGRAATGGGGGGHLVERLPQALLLDILSMLDVRSLYATAPVCRALRASVSQVLSLLSTLDLSKHGQAHISSVGREVATILDTALIQGFTPTTQILNRVMSNSYGLRSLTIDCSRLDDSSVRIFAKKQLEELVLLKCFHFSSYIFLGIGQSCSNLRVLSLELACEPCFADNCNKTIQKMFRGCLHLESLSMKFHSLSPLHGEFDIIQLHLPKTIKTFLLQPASNKQAMERILNTRLGSGENLPLETAVHNPVSQPSLLMLQSLTLVLDAITDELITTIGNRLPYLIHLSLEDNPQEKSSLSDDLSNTGLQSLSSSGKLTRLSLSRSRPNVFRRVTDVGVLVLAEGCKELESVRLGGFSKLTDAAYITILQSFRNLRRFEIINGYFLSDLAFHDIGSVADSLVEVVLISCNLLTSETAESLSSCNNLTVLDLGGCRSIADRGLNSLAMLRNLTLLDLSGADITDGGLSALGLCSSSIDTLRLRGCKRIGDRGFKKLLRVDGAISRTLSTLDLGYLPGLSDETIAWIGKTCRSITSLCIRHCFSVTDASIRFLGSMEDAEGERRSIKGLDLYNCRGLSIDSIKLFYQPFFQGLRWLGIGNTKLNEGRERSEELSKERPWLNICVYGCEMRCKDGWFLH